MLHQITPGIALAFLPGIAALCLASFFFRKASRNRSQGAPFGQKATLAFFTLLLAAALLLAALLLLAVRLQS